MRIKHAPALLAPLAVILASVVYLAGTSNGGVSPGSVFASSSGSTTPDATWLAPIQVTGFNGHDDNPQLAASPLNGSARIVWTRTDNSTGEIVTDGNHSLGGAFGQDQIIDSAGVTLIEAIGIAHDSAGRSHMLSWRWPSPQNFCDYYKQFDANGVLTLSEVIPGTCDVNTPRKLGAIAVDANLTVHIILGRDGVPGSMEYWERTNAGVWSVQSEPLPAGCAPADLSLAVTTQGKVMAAWKDCGSSGQGSDIYTALRVAANNWQLEDISESCCAACPGTSGAYLPRLAADPAGGIRAAWADGRCASSDPTDIYYREWTGDGSGWSGHPIVQVVSNSGNSYYPSITVDGTGEAHIAWGDDTSSPFAYYRIFYAHGHGTVFSAPTIPFDPWFPSSWQRDPSIDYAFNAVHVAFSSIRDDPDKDVYYSYAATSPPPTPTPQPPPCPGESFTDVCPGTYYYTAVNNLASNHIISGYTTAPPCPSASWIACFLPNRSATRGQVSKIIVLGAGLPINTNGGPHFNDVPTTNTFYQYIETLYNAGDINGYTTGCTTRSPCFKPNNNVTRGQLTKMATLAFGFNQTVSGQTFQDIPPGSTFYTYTQRLTSLGIISGYPCGGAGEPCVPPTNRPYFRPNSNITRAQLAKIVDLCRQH